MVRNEGSPQHNDLRLEVIVDRKQLLDIETNRVQFYLREYPKYVRNGYAGIIRFPPGITPSNLSSEQELRKKIAQEMEENWHLYEQFGGELQAGWNSLQPKVLPTAESLYGYSIKGNFKVAPTAYGTVGTGSYNGNPIYFRLPTFRPDTLGELFTTGKYRSPAEMLIHDVLAHSATAPIRTNTVIAEEIISEYPRHMEYVMDLLGRTMCDRSGLMKKTEVAMQKVSGQIVDVIDKIYYRNPLQQDEYDLNFDGNVARLMQEVDTMLRRTA